MTIEEFKEQTKGKKIFTVSDINHLIETGEIKVKILNIDLNSKSPEIGDLSTLKYESIIPKELKLSQSEFVNSFFPELETTSEKEYAKDLVYFFELQTPEQMTHYNAKECALKVVQEIKKHNERFHFSSYNFEESTKSLILVEKEIELL